MTTPDPNLDPSSQTKVVSLKLREAYDFYIGRSTSAPTGLARNLGADGVFGNPVKKGATCPECGAIHQEAGDTLPCFERYFLRRIATDVEFRTRVIALRGKRIACFCAPGPCHGDVYVAWLDGHRPLYSGAPKTAEQYTESLALRLSLLDSSFR